MSGLTRRNLVVLADYASEGNRELYWNYLAQQPGSDGYALLALGVVRDDNVPGRVANAYATEFARYQQTRHGSDFADRPRITEREWDAFGSDLIKQDLAHRRQQLNELRPDLALNLPVRDVQDSHDIAFRDHQIDPNAWTPRILLEAARSRDGEAAAERIWSDLLNNDVRGLERGADTLRHVGRYLDGNDALRYGATLGLLRTAVIHHGSNTDPDVVHRAQGLSTHRDRDGTWRDVSSGSHGVSTMAVRDPQRLAELEDTRALRLEVQQRRTQFHVDDPHRTIAASPRVLADNGREEAPGYLVAALAPEAIDDLRDRRHPGHGHYGEALQRVSLFEAQQGIRGGAYSERLAASLAVVAKYNDVDLGSASLRRGADGGIVVDERPPYGAAGGDRHIRIDVETLSSLPIAQSSREWARLQSPHYLSDAAPAARSADNQHALARLPDRDRAMFERIRGEVPPQIGDDHVLHAVLATRDGAIRDAAGVQAVRLAGDTLHVVGMPAGTVRVDVTSPVPDCSTTAQRLAGLDREQTLAQMQMQTQQHERSPSARGMESAALSM